MASSRIADQVGSVLGGRYRLIAPIGTGASAHVYLADDVTLKRRVAVKVLHAALASDESFLRRFRAEAQAVAGLRHPHIMSVYDWGEDDSGPYLVLEHLGGGSLRDLLDGGARLSPSQALLVGLEAARALDYAHRRGLVHRDIKPANLLFDDEGRLAIADFGLARALAEAAWTEPTGAVLGTARYASPEQARGSSVDGRSDVYALALCLVEAVTGTVPFAADTTIATLMGRIDRPLEVPDALGALQSVLRAAGHPDPAERLDAAGLARGLDAAAAHLDAPAPLPLAGSAVIDLTAAPVDDITQLPPPADAALATTDGDTAGPAGSDDPGGGSPPRRRRRWLRGTLIFALILAAGVTAVAAVAQARIPRHAVPSLRGLTLAEARQEVLDERFELEVVGREFDENTTDGQILNQEPATGELREGSVVEVVVSKGPKPRAVPSLAGLSAADAEAELVAAGFTPAFTEAFHPEIPAGTVISWSPEEGDQPKGTEVVVTVSKGPEPKPVPNPSIVDRLLDPFRKLLEELGLREQRVEVFSDTVPKGAVVGTEPGPGQMVVPGSTVKVFVSKGPEMVTIPDVAGMTVSEATERLNRSGLEVSGVRGNPNRLVVGSDPKAGTQVKKGTAVTIVTR